MNARIYITLYNRKYNRVFLIKCFCFLLCHLSIICAVVEVEIESQSSDPGVSVFEI